MEPRFYIFTGLVTCLCYALISLFVRKKLIKIKLGQGLIFIISLIVSMLIVMGLRYYSMTQAFNPCP